MSNIIRSFANLIFRGAIIRKAQEDSVNEFIGCEVLEHVPSGKLYRAVITHVRWESSVLPVNWQKGEPEGDWMIGIRYVHDGSQCWTSHTSLRLTGTKYPNVDAVVKINPLYESAWQ